MKKLLTNISLVTILILQNNIVQATPSVFYENARSLGMGGVSVPIADDYLAIYRNPAGISLHKKDSFSVLSPTFSRNSDFSDVMDHIDSLSDNDTAVTRISNYKNLEAIIGKAGFQNWSDTAYYISENGYALSVKYNDYQFYTVENPSSPKVKSSIYKDTVFTGTFSRPFENDNQNILNDKATGWWGVNLKIANRKMTETSYSARDFAALTPKALKDTDRSGLAFDADFGALWQITNPLKPTIGISVGNIFESKFSDETGNLKRYYSIGTSVKPIHGEQERSDRLVLACEYFDDGSHKNSFNKIRLGAQVQVAEGCHFLTGIKGGYFTAGLNYSWKDLTFAASTYAEELGNRAGDREDRRYAVDASLRF
jgi:hypothetical protein